MHESDWAPSHLSQLEAAWSSSTSNTHISKTGVSPVVLGLSKQTDGSHYGLVSLRPNGVLQRLPNITHDRCAKRAVLVSPTGASSALQSSSSATLTRPYQNQWCPDPHTSLCSCSWISPCSDTQEAKMQHPPPHQSGVLCLFQIFGQCEMLQLYPRPKCEHQHHTHGWQSLGWWQLQPAAADTS